MNKDVYIESAAGHIISAAAHVETFKPPYLSNLAMRKSSVQYTAVFEHMLRTAYYIVKFSDYILVPTKISTDTTVRSFSAVLGFLYV